VSFGAFDEEDPRSMINLVPTRIKGHILKAITPKLGGDIRFISWSETRLERELCKLLPEVYGDQYKKLEAIDHAIRLNFWAEYYRAQDAKNQMIEKNIVRKITRSEDFHNRMSIPLYTAWIISAPTDLAISQEDTLNQAMRQLRSIVTDKNVLWETTKEIVTDSEGVKTETTTRILNTKAVDSLRKVAGDLSLRIQGSITQKHLIAQIPKGGLPSNYAIKNIGVPALPPAAESREDLEKEIEILEADIEDIPNDIPENENVLEEELESLLDDNGFEAEKIPG